MVGGHSIHVTVQTPVQTILTFTREEKQLGSVCVYVRDFCIMTANLVLYI